MLDKPNGTKAVLPCDKANALNDAFNSIFTVENMDIPLPTEEFKEKFCQILRARQI